VSHHILVVDDDPDILSVVTEVLGVEGYAVEPATNGAEALQVIERELPALVLLDMRMPVLDGWGFARALRERGIQLPILVMTAAQNAQLWCDEIAADGCVPKPFELTEMLTTVEEFYAP
jgi:CheY-like chemotaxis protein